MKIKVVTLKDLIKYLAKISIIFGVIAIFANFFYSKKNVVNYFSYDSRKFLMTLKSEIVLLKQNEDVSFNMFDNEKFSNTINGCYI